MSLLNDALRKKKNELRHFSKDPGLAVIKARPEASRKMSYWLTAVCAGVILAAGSLAWMFWSPSVAAFKPAAANPLNFPTDGTPSARPPSYETPPAKPTAEHAQPLLADSFSTSPPATVQRPIEAPPVQQPVRSAPAKPIPETRPASPPVIPTENLIRKGSDISIPASDSSAATLKQSTDSLGGLSKHHGQKGNVEQFYQKARLYHRQERIEDAIAMYREVLRLDPEHFDTCFNLSAAYLQANEFVKAGLMAADLYRRAPENPRVALNLAIAQIGCGRPGQAIELLDKAAVQNDAPLFEILFHKGVAYRLLDRLEESITWYRRAEQLKPADARLMFNLAVALDQQQQYDQAIFYYRAYLGTSKNLDPVDRQQIDKRIRALRTDLPDPANEEAQRR